MRKQKILIVDDDPDILDILRLTLSEDYDTIEAQDGETTLKFIKTKAPDLVVLDYKIPAPNGREICLQIRRDLLLRHLPIIMLTGKKEITDKIEGLDAGADDYITKPFEPRELLARIRMILRRTERDLEANPLTRLPGNISILNELSSRIEKNGLFAVCYLDLNKFKNYNDEYGFEHGDEVIRETARILIRAKEESGDPNDFIGHIGGDDFVYITTPDIVERVCNKIIEDFDKISPNFYNEEDRRRSYIIARDRKGEEIRVKLLSVSIGVVTNLYRKIIHLAQIGEIGAELKAYAKQREDSNYVIDKRR